MSGDITYNGHGLKEFVPQRTSAYVTQQDWHIAEMTVRETLDFSVRCQGVGSKYGKVVWDSSSCFDISLTELLNFATDMLLELSRREKMAGIKPDEDLDIFIKVSVVSMQMSMSDATLLRLISMLTFFLTNLWQFIHDMYS